jgi:hypothetical protein
MAKKMAASEAGCGWQENPVRTGRDAHFDHGIFLVRRLTELDRRSMDDDRTSRLGFTRGNFGGCWWPWRMCFEKKNRGGSGCRSGGVGSLEKALHPAFQPHSGFLRGRSGKERLRAKGVRNTRGSTTIDLPLQSQQSSPAVII